VSPQVGGSIVNYNNGGWAQQAASCLHIMASQMDLGPHPNKALPGAKRLPNSRH